VNGLVSNKRKGRGARVSGHLIGYPLLHAGGDELCFIQPRLIGVGRKIKVQVEAISHPVGEVVIEGIVKTRKVLESTAQGRATPCRHSQIPLAVG